MICIVIVGPSIEEAREQIKGALKYADLIELRLDRFNNRSPHLLKSLLQEFSLPGIFTLRSKLHGGDYTDNEDRRLQELRDLATCKPSYLDLEDHIPQSFINEIHQAYPEIKLIVSYHDFKSGLPNLDRIYSMMPKVKDAFYKIAIMPDSLTDTLNFISKAQQYPDLIPVCMGEHGEISRILARLFKNPMTYASLEKNFTTAPGQIPAKALVDIYRYKSMTVNTQLYGLIGDPIAQSISHITHNMLLGTLSLNARYIKLKVGLNELKESLPLLKNMGFRGLSVTMPYKESIIPYIDELDSHAKVVGAVNTLLFDQGCIIGYNTDGHGALESLEVQSSVNGKIMIILGAGGAARAIAYEAKKRGAKIILLNRDVRKAKQLAEEMGCIGDSLEAMPKYFESRYDFLINCIPYPFSIDSKYFIQNATVMDINTKPMMTPFLIAAQLAGSWLVYGYEMFIRQALKQFEIWFPGKIEKESAYHILHQTAYNALQSANP